MPEEMRVDEGGGRQGVRRVEYPSNSKTPKPQPPEKEKVESVVTGEVIRRKRSPFARLTQQFVAEDSGSVLDYLIQDVLVPAAKSLLYDMFTEGLHRKLYGDSRPKSSAQRGYTNYQARSVSTAGARHIPIPDRDGKVTPLNRYQRTNHDFGDIILANRGDVEDVLDRLRDLINEYGHATVADFYDLVGLTGEFTDDKWGWYDLRSASVKMVRGGYMFNLPRTQSIT